MLPCSDCSDRALVLDQRMKFQGTVRLQHQHHHCYFFHFPHYYLAKSFQAAVLSCYDRTDLSLVVDQLMMFQAMLCWERNEFWIVSID